MGVNRSSLSRAMQGNRGGIQRQAPRAQQRGRAPQHDEVSVSGFSPVRMKKGGAYEQTIFGQHLDKINRPNGARLGAVQIPIITASSDGRQLVVRVFSPQGIQVTHAKQLFLAGNRGGTFYTWVFGPNDVGAPKGFRFGGPGGPSNLDDRCGPDCFQIPRTGGGYHCVCDLTYQQQMGLRAGPPGGPLPPGYPPGGGPPPPPPPPPPNPYQKQMGLKTAQASGRNRARLSRFTNVRRR